LHPNDILHTNTARINANNTRPNNNGDKEMHYGTKYTEQARRQRNLLIIYIITIMEPTRNTGLCLARFGLH